MVWHGRRDENGRKGVREAEMDKRGREKSSTRNNIVITAAAADAAVASFSFLNRSSIYLSSRAFARTIAITASTGQTVELHVEIHTCIRV